MISSADEENQQSLLRAKAYHVSQPALTFFDCNLKSNIDIELISTFHQGPFFMEIMKDDQGKVKLQGMVFDHLNFSVQALANAKYEITFTIITDSRLFLNYYSMFIIKKRVKLFQ